MREDYLLLEKKFLAARALAKRESLSLACLISWCEAGDLEARRIGDHWFIYLHDWEISGNRLINDLPRYAIPNASQSLIFVSTVLLLIGILNAKPFRAGTVFLTATAGQTMQHYFVENKTPARMRMASVYDVLWIQLDHLWLETGQVTETVTGNLVYFWQQAVEAWRGFLNRDDGASKVIDPGSSSTSFLTLDPATLETLKNEIRAELLRDLKSSPAGNSVAAPSNAPGLVVLPSTGDPTRDAALKLELKNSFSDQVEVKFDPSGQAGIITPIFPSGRGGNYLFILTPLKPSP